MKLTKEARRMSRQLFRDSFTNGQLDDAKIADLVDIIGDTKPRQYMSVLKDYQRLIRLEVERRHALIESAAALGPDLARKIERDLKAKFGENITTEFKTNPQLIAGLRIKLGSNVWDGTVKNRLQRLDQELSHA